MLTISWVYVINDLSYVVTGTWWWKLWTADETQPLHASLADTNANKTQFSVLFHWILHEYFLRITIKARKNEHDRIITSINHCHFGLPKSFLNPMFVYAFVQTLNLRNPMLTFLWVHWGIPSNLELPVKWNNSTIFIPEEFSPHAHLLVALEQVKPLLQ